MFGARPLEWVDRSHAGLMGDYAATQRPSERSDRRGDSAGVLKYCLSVFGVGRRRLVVVSAGSSS